MLMINLKIQCYSWIYSRGFKYATRWKECFCNIQYSWNYRMFEDKKINLKTCNALSVEALQKSDQNSTKVLLSTICNNLPVF